ncbi:hypothetical protein JD844_002731 [Phrynosoma platyrhinos]|uniref:Serine/threonine-protein kinase ULK4/RUNKEL HEAT repeats domain-containing protein n=1 Tax=Phrynosoma platyrhinos TaxID=52577 RepID=A0ABQ7TCI7_PHRPL|nr:hypothetical protein JD844_002731 [Phrynosoma platyrhinos]
MRGKPMNVDCSGSNSRMIIHVPPWLSLLLPFVSVPLCYSPLALSEDDYDPDSFLQLSPPPTSSPKLAVEVMDCILPPLVSLVSSQNVEWRLASLRLLSETTSLLVSHEVMAEEKENLNSSSKLLSLVRDSLLPQLEQILMAPDPVPAYALKLLVTLTEYSPAFAR